MNEQTSFFEPTPIEKVKTTVLNFLADLLSENGLSGMNAKFENQMPPYLPSKFQILGVKMGVFLSLWGYFWGY